MGTAIGLRDDFDGATLRRLARVSKSANQARRLLALAEIADGGSRTRAAEVSGMGLQIVRDWVIRLKGRGPDGLLDGKAPGARPRLNDAQRRALVDAVERGPILAHAIPCAPNSSRNSLCDPGSWSCPCPGQWASRLRFCSFSCRSSLRMIQ